jgi:hypothetical protein
MLDRMRSAKIGVKPNPEKSEKTKSPASTGLFVSIARLRTFSQRNVAG